MWRHPPLTASRKPVGYLGLTRASISPAARRRKGRRISKRGSPQTRWAPVNAAWSVVQEPRPPPAFYERVRARRGHQIGVVASARKARLLFWSLHRSEDHPQQQPSLTAKKLRLLEIRAGAQDAHGHQHRAVRHSPADAQGRARLAQPAEGLLQANGRRLASSGGEEGGRERDIGVRIDQGPFGARSRGRPTNARRLPFDTSSARAQTQPNAAHPPRPTSTATRRAQIGPQPAPRPRRRNRAHRRRSPVPREPSATDPTPRKVAAATSTCIGRPTQERAPAR
jgi:hypothetical protein